MIKLVHYLSVPLAFLLFALPLGAQSMDRSLIDTESLRSSSPSASAGRFDLEQKLKEMEKKETEIEQLSQYVPLEGPVDEQNYIIGPGDIFVVGIAGAVEERIMVPVGADGQLVIPQVSAVDVGGLPLADARQKVLDKLSEIFREDELSVSLVGARIFNVQVTGKVAAPGDHKVTAAHRLYSAVELAGGKLPVGDLSRVKLYRDEDTLEYDLSLFLSEGDINENPFLLDGDIIVVPGVDLSEPLVYVSGAGRVDGLVNIDPSEDFQRLMERIGADRDMVNIAEIGLVREGEKYNVDLLASEGPVSVQPGDSIFFTTLVDSVYVGGRVNRGGSQPYIAGADYMTYVGMAGGIASEGTWHKVKVVRAGETMSPRKAGEIRRGDVIMIGTSTWYVTTEILKSLGEVASLATVIYTIGFRD